MPTKLQLRRGTTSDHSSFTGAVGEVTVDTTLDTLVVHDGSTAGGFTLAKLSNISVTDSGGDGSLSYDSSTGILTYTGPSASEVRAHITAGAGISVSSGVVTLDILDEDNMATDSATKAPSQQSVKAYVASQIATKDNTDEMTEGSTNLYFTNARADARIAASDTDALSEGSTNLYHTSARADARFDVKIAAADTDALSEGSSNLYYTNARADARAQLKIDALVDSAPGALDTLNELAAALGDDADFSTTITNSIATKLATDDFNSTFDTRLASKSTTNVSEGTNLYYTNARADARIANALVDEDNMASDSATQVPSQQSVKAYVDSQVATKDNTDEITEGSSNLYYTDARADARITNALLDEDDLSSDSATNIPSQQSVKAYVDAQVAGKDNTDEITEGSSNLYYTDARADARITNALIDEDNMATDSATKLPSQQSVKAYVDAQTTDETAEGSSNLYYTNSRVNSQVDAYLNAGTGITLAGSGAIAVNTSVIPTITAMNTAISTATDALVDSAPGALDTLNELAAAMGDDSNFSTTVTNSIATKAPLASPGFSGVPTAPTASTGTNTLQLATTAFVKQEIDALKALLYAYDQS